VLVQKSSKGAQHSTTYSSLYQFFLICSIISNIPTSSHMSLQFLEYNISSIVLCLLSYSMHNICNFSGSIPGGVSHGGFFTWLPMEPCALGSTQPLKMSTRDFSWGKGSQCVRLTNYHPCSAERQENLGP
jgi:hypothetical protein